MISTTERGHLESDLRGPVIIRRAEHHIQCDFSCAACFPTGDCSSKGCAASLNAAPVYFHFSEGFLVSEVQSAAAVHEYLCKSEVVHYRTKDQWAGARAVQNLGSSLALKVIAVSLHGFFVATW